MRPKRAAIFIVLFFLTLEYPLTGFLTDSKIELSGVTEGIETVEASSHTLGDGSYQSYMNSIWKSNFPERSLMINLRNQLLFSAFGISLNTNVIVGKDKYLFEPR